MIKPFKLGYAEFATNKIQEMLDYYTNLMGFTLVEEGEDGKKYLSSSLDHHNIVLTPSNNRELQSIGFQIDEKTSIQDAEKFLLEEGFHIKRKTDAAPGIPEMLEFQDPDNYVIQLYTEIETPAPGFKTDGIVPNKLGHIALGSKVPTKSLEFYQRILGFTLTDRIGDRATFLTCNTDHHVLNISNIGYSTMHHIAFELRDFSHQKVSSDLLAKHKIPIVWGPSRHTAGHNIATYHHDPDENLIELFTDMDVFIPELGYFDPRPWHEDLPQKPKVWEGNCSWGTGYEISLLESALKKLNV